MSFALVEDLPLYDSATGVGTRLKSELKAMTSASIFFTVFVLGGCTFYVMDLLDMTPSARQDGERETELVGLMEKGSEDKEDLPDHDDPSPIAQGKNFRQRIQK